MTAKQATFYLLRHGLPEGDQCLRGQVDFAITSKGLQQMQQATSRLKPLNAIHSSPLKRCADFARQFARQQKIPLKLEKSLMEYDFGDWDGKPYAQLWQEDGQALGNFFERPWANTPPNGETAQHFASRLDHYWQELIDKHQGQAILICCHGGVIRHILARILGLSAEVNTLHNTLNIPYAALVKLTINYDNQGKAWPQIHWPEPQPSLDL
jgi:broad specificity phosphatase PhoE